MRSLSYGKELILYIWFKAAYLSCGGRDNGAIIFMVGSVMGLFYDQRGEMIFMIRDYYCSVKHILLLCFVGFLLSGNLAWAATVKLYSNYDATFADPSVLTVAYGDTNSLVRMDNYKSHDNGVVQAYSITVKYFAVQDVPGFGRFTNELYADPVYFFVGRDGQLHAESNSEHEKNLLASSEFTNNLQNMLQSYHPDIYSFLLQMAAVQQEKEKQLAQQQLANEMAAIQANPARRHYLADNLWKEEEKIRVQIVYPELAAYWENNAIHYGSYYSFRDNLPESYKGFLHMYLKRNDLTDYGQYVIVTKENNMYTCFDYNADTDSFIIYSNTTHTPDYSLHFYKNESTIDAKATNISGNPVYSSDGQALSWTTLNYEGSADGDYWCLKWSQWSQIFIPSSRTDGYRLFLQYGKLLK